MACQLEAEEVEAAQIIHIPEEWSKAAEAIKSYNSNHSYKPPIAFICGPKNSGKTTFSRYLLNVFLRRYGKVGYLDTDVGQPEFTVPGFLSLTLVDKPTPDLTTPCLKTPERCFFFGDISSKRDPTLYLKYVHGLYDRHKCSYGITGDEKLPLVVNTPGWVKGVGYDILVDMLRYIGPTHVVKINIYSERKNLPSGAFWLEDYNDNREINLIEISSAYRDPLNRLVLIPKDASRLRDFRIMAYFRQCLSNSMNITTIKELARGLASHPPYQVPLSSIKIRHLHCQVPDTEIFYSLNATIVGLAIGSEETANMPYCVGLGIVRGIDTLRGLLYVITPIVPSILGKVDILLQGFIEIPTCLLQVQGCMSPYMSANVLPTS